MEFIIFRFLSDVQLTSWNSRWKCGLKVSITEISGTALNGPSGLSIRRVLDNNNHIQSMVMPQHLNIYSSLPWPCYYLALEVGALILHAAGGEDSLAVLILLYDSETLAVRPA